MHRPLADTGKVRARFRVTGVEDKGPERGALLHQMKELVDAETEEPIASIRYTLMLRGNGGEGSLGEVSAVAAPLPRRAADLTMEIRTGTGAAILHLLTGEHNPPHP